MGNTVLIQTIELAVQWAFILLMLTFMGSIVLVNLPISERTKNTIYLTTIFLGLSIVVTALGIIFDIN